MLAAPPGQRWREVRRDERAAPALDLADMGLLVVAAGLEAGDSRPMITWPSVMASKPLTSKNQVAKPPWNSSAPRRHWTRPPEQCQAPGGQAHEVVGAAQV